MVGYFLCGQLWLQGSDGCDWFVDGILQQGIIWVDLQILFQFDVKVGDIFRLGDLVLKIVVVIVIELDCGSVFVNFVLCVMFNEVDLVVMYLVQVGLCVIYCLLIVGLFEVVQCYQQQIECQIDVDKLCGVCLELLENGCLEMCVMLDCVE